MSSDKVALKEMVNAEAEFISLVPRGANRIPFRILKEDKVEKNMIDLGAIGKIFKGDKKSVTPEVVAYGVEKGSNFEDKTEVLKSIGLAVDNVVDNEDGSVMYVQKQFTQDEVTTVRMSDNLVAIVKNFNAYPADGVFGELVKAQGFFTDVCSASDTLRHALSEALYRSSTKDDAKSRCSTIIKDFSDYVTKLVTDLPEIAFKADLALADLAEKVEKAAASEEEKAKAEAKAKEEAEQQAALEAAEKEKAGKADMAPEGVDQETWDTMSDEEKAEWKAKTPAKIEKSDKAEPVDVEAVVALVTKAMAPMFETTIKAAIDPLGAIIAGVKDQVGTLATDVGSLQEKVGKAEKVLGSTITAPSLDTDPARQAAKKVDKDLIGSGAVWDSAFHKV